MGDRWQLQEAKNRLNEWVRKARDEGPQTITVHGADAAVVVSDMTCLLPRAARPSNGGSGPRSRSGDTEDSRKGLRHG
jgi:prevent-host-death family protein